MRLAICLTLMLVTPLAAAQEGPPPPPGDVTDVNAAAAAFQEGQRLQLAREHARAAEFFEIADHSAPSPAALRSAIRSHQAAGHAVRAATLSLRARSRDAADPQSAQLADAVLAEAAPRLTRVHVTCSPGCTVTVDRLAVGDGTGESHAFFVEPGPRTLETRWANRGTRTRSLDCTAGQSVELSLDAPPPEPAPPPAPTPTVATPPPAPVLAVLPPLPTAPVVRPRQRPLPPLVFWIGLAATAASAGVLVWSGLDTLSARDAYVQRPTEAGYNDGASREVRTDVLIASTAVLGVATAVVGVFFTEWSGRGAERSGLRTAPSLGLRDGGLQVGVVRSF